MKVRFLLYALLIATSIMGTCVYVATNAVLKTLMDRIYYAFFD